MAKAEIDMRANLTDLSKIPVKEFEKHFRDWMERDDVARALQAKLRTDLISNFNKTALGRQILAHTTTTTTGGSTQRLTLSPLVLALNTLVAEFLYAQNCHFSLSVFCTEVPFRNTLPDFENSQHFRFTADEIKEILEAIFGKSSYEAAFKNGIIKKYEGSKNLSLLLLIIRYLLLQKEECLQQIASFKSGAVTEGTQTTEVNNEPRHTEGYMPSQGSPESRRSKAQIPNSNMRYLNKYLMILSTKVKEMSEQFEELRNKRGTLPSTRLSKSVRARRYENLNRSLERIMGQLKHMTHTKRKSRQVVAVVSAVDALATQFSKCVESFKSVSRELMTNNDKQNQMKSTVLNKPLQSQAEVQVDLFGDRVQGGEQKKAAEEKTYIDWVHEMRHTKNGQKFLDRIEATLKKALNKQRELLRNESEEKLCHQKELLKIKYKEKLMEHVSCLPAHDYSKEARMLNESIGQQLQEFETRHAVLLQKIQEVHEEGVQVLPQASGQIEVPPVADATSEMTEEIVRRVVKEMEPKGNTMESRVKENPVCETRTRDPVLKDVVNTQKQLQKMVQNIAQQERNVDQIVNDAKMRIQELENESNQLELNFRNYLERQRLQAETMREVVASLSEEHKNEKPSLKASAKYCATIRNIKEAAALKAQDKRRGVKIKSRDKTLKPKDSLIDLTNQENKSPNPEYRNAILDAKLKLFKNVCAGHYKITTKSGSDDDELSVSAVEPFYYNRNFGRCESQNNLLTNHAYTNQLYQKAPSLMVNPSQLTLTSISTLPLTSTDLNYSVDATALSTRTDKSCTQFPNARPNNLQQPMSKHEQSSWNAKPLPSLADATISIVNYQKTTTPAVGIVAVANGERIEALTENSESEMSSSTKADTNPYDQSIDNSSNNSGDSNGSANKVKQGTAEATRSTRTTSKVQQINTRLLASREEREQTSKTVHTNCEYNNLTTNQATSSTTLIETMERMHRLFTEAPIKETEEKWRQTQTKMCQKPKLKQQQMAQLSQPNKQQLKSTPKTVLISEEPSTSAQAIASSKADQHKSQIEVIPQTSLSKQTSEQPLNRFPTTEPAAKSIAEKRATSETETQYYNITIPNIALGIDALAPTISSTTFSICVDDNLKEVVSESSIEIASMSEAVDEDIELDELAADVEEEDEEEQEEELEPMVDDNVAYVPMPSIAEVSDISSSSSDALTMSHGGGGGVGGGVVVVDPRKHSDSGSDFWE